MKEVLREIEARGLSSVRFSFADQHGVLRGKTLAAAEVKAALERGVSVTSTLLLKDTSHKTVFPAFTPGGGVGMPELQGAADVLMKADPATFRVLPWAPGTGWLLCDLQFQDGRAVPFCTRTMLKDALRKIAAAGYGFFAGLEIEFHVFRIVDAHLKPSDAGQPGTPPEVEPLRAGSGVELLATGYQYLTEQRYDLIDPVVETLRKGLEKLGLPLRSYEVEFGPIAEFALTDMRENRYLTGPTFTPEGAFLAVHRESGEWVGLSILKRVAQPDTLYTGMTGVRRVIDQMTVKPVVKQ